MARRNRNKKNRSKAVARRFAQVSQTRFVDQTLSYEECKAQQRAHHQALAVKEKEILATTIFVTNVKDLHEASNVLALRHFFETSYGPVTECKATFRQDKHGKRRSNQRFPPGRVRFLHERDARKVFRGTELLRVTEPVQLSCSSVGHRNGTINVRPCMLYDEMLDQELKGPVVTLQPSRLCLGHWCPSRLEMVIPSNQNVDDFDDSVIVQEQEMTNEWLGVMDGVAPLVSIDTNNGTIELAASRDDSWLNMLRLESSQYLIIRFKQLASPLELCRDEATGEFSLIFALKYPPKLEVDILVIRSYGETEMERHRSLSWGNLQAHDFGRCLGYKLSVTSSQVDALLMHQNCERLRRFGVLQLDSSENPTLIVTRTIGQRSDEIFESKLINSVPDIRVGMLLRALVDHGKTCTYHVMNDNSVVLEDGSGPATLFDLVNVSAPHQVEETLERMLDGFGRTRYPSQLFHGLIYANFPSRRNETDLYEHCVSIPRIQLTPCRLFVVGFEVETSNRVIRKFASKEGFKPESFLRLQVTDEDSRLIFSQELTAPIQEKLKNIILSGITLCGRQYEFLAYSSSQLKECSLWMVCPPPSWTVAKIRSELGDFSVCKTASKYAARIGQCFSTTFRGAEGQDHVGFGEERLRHERINDIIGGPGMCHSDGTGMIRRAAMNQLLARVPFSPIDPQDVAIIQIRFGGAKGTLTAWDDPGEFAPGSRPADVYLRDSMIKFHARYEELEVCSVGRHVPYYLNRNVILLLSAHGVPDNTFLSMQRAMVKDLDQMMVSRYAALSMLPKLGGPDSEQRSMLLYMLQGGLSPARDPFLLDCLFSIRSHHLYNLRKKARIFVEKGAVLMGGIDETGLLPEGTIFCEVQRQLSMSNPHSESALFEPVVGPVLVTKHPVMHPGDVRMLLAIDIPELRGHRNMILFSRNGSRPEADKMSGSDLDGDEFAVTWDERLFLGIWNGCRSIGHGRFVTRGGSSIDVKNVEAAVEVLACSNAAPMDFSDNGISSFASPLPSVEDTKLLSSALVQHFLEHIKLASVGRICMLWLDHAAEKGAKCDECIKLAKLHSIAVDYPKSGIPASIPLELHLSSGTARAHWREKKSSPSKHCESILGMLYDEVVRSTHDTIPREARTALAGRKRDEYGTITTLTQEGWIDTFLRQLYNSTIHVSLGLSVQDEGSDYVESLQKFADDERQEYEDGVLRLMRKYKLRGEGEISTGCIRKYHRLHKKRQQEFSQDVKRQCRELRRHHRLTFFRKVLKLVQDDMTREQQEPRSSTASSPTPVDVLIKAQNESSTNIDDAEESIGDSTSVDADSMGDDDNELINDAEDIKWAHGVVTAKLGTTQGSMKEAFALRHARQLAAAYYEATYSPDLRWDTRRYGSQALFGFPWIVADVIGHALAEMGANED